MTGVTIKIGVLTVCCLASGWGVASAQDLLLRLFLADGTSVVSYGEYARFEDRVVFSMVTGGDAEPRLHVATLPADAIDWARTDQHATSTQYQHYVQTRAEDDFQCLSDDVASVLGDVLLTADRGRAIEVAQQARATLAEWPRQHYGYRQRDIREILAFLDEVISDLRAAAGMTSFEVVLVAMAADIALEPMAAMPSAREQIDQVLRVASRTERPSERVALLQTALLLLDEAGATIGVSDGAALRRIAEGQIREEQAIDAKYTRLARRRPSGDLQVMHDLLVSAWRFAENAVDGRYQAARVASDERSRQASSAAAGALLLLADAQREIRDFLEAPRLQ